MDIQLHNMILLWASIVTSEDTQDDIDSITKVVMIANSVFVLGIDLQVPAVQSQNMLKYKFQMCFCTWQSIITFVGTQSVIGSVTEYAYHKSLRICYYTLHQLVSFKVHHFVSLPAMHRCKQIKHTWKS